MAAPEAASGACLASTSLANHLDALGRLPRLAYVRQLPPAAVLNSWTVVGPRLSSNYLAVSFFRSPPIAWATALIVAPPTSAPGPLQTPPTDAIAGGWPRPRRGASQAAGATASESQGPQIELAPAQSCR